MIPQVHVLHADATFDGTLMLVPTGPIQVVITRHLDMEGNPSATIAFGGCNQAHITFDATGTRPIGYFMYNPNPLPQLMQSVQNIVDWFAGPPTMH